MEFVVNDSHKKIVISNEIKPCKVNFHINDSIIKINVYSGCKNITNKDNFPIANKDLYDIDYDVDNGLYIIDDIEVDSFPTILKSISNVCLEDVKYR